MKRHANSQRQVSTSGEPKTAALLLVCLAVFGSLSYMRSEGHLQFLNLTVYDLFLRLLPRENIPNPYIVLVQVTENDINTLGEWPLSDQTLSRSLQVLKTQQPRAIGLDIYRDRPVPPGTMQFYTTLQNYPNVIMINKFGANGESTVAGLDFLERTGRLGFSDIVLDSGGKVRRGLLFLDDGEVSASSFALMLSLNYLYSEGIQPRPGKSDPSFIQLGKATLPPFTANDGPYTSADAAGYQLILDFNGGELPFQTVSLTQLLERKFSPDTFTDKIVLLGVAAESVKDNFFTPFSNGKDQGMGVPGVVIHAHLASQIVRAALNGDKPIASLNQYVQYGWILLWCIAGTIISLFAHSISRFIAITSGGFFLLGSTAFIAFTSGLWVPFVAPALGWFASLALITAYHSGQERDKRKLLTQLFSAHVSDKVAEEIWNKRSQFIEGNRLIPQEITATVLFTDIEKFTTISEALTPDELMDWLNIYMEAMANTVMAHGGVIDDYYGDAIKANFGVPVGHSQIDRIRGNAIDAIRCALHMNTELESVNKLCKKKGMPELRMRIGICTGNVVAGCIGSSKRMKYTTVGDTVNIAARLESFDKTQFSGTDHFTNCRILISESTWKLVNAAFATEAVGKLPLKGKQETIGVYHVTGKGPGGTL